MSTERELLELAAKACGINTSRCLQYADGAFDWTEKVGRWNPLSDDGDCARMEAKLGIDVYWHQQYVKAWADKTGSIPADYFDHNGDKNAARRAASVAVAAKIGRSMP